MKPLAAHKVNFYNFSNIRNLGPKTLDIPKSFHASSMILKLKVSLSSIKLCNITNAKHSPMDQLLSYTLVNKLSISGFVSYFSTNRFLLILKIFFSLFVEFDTALLLSCILQSCRKKVSLPECIRTNSPQF